MRASILVLLVVLFAFGCSSVPLRISTMQDMTLNKDYEILGDGEGEATGVMLFGLIPIGQNERFERAYKAAVESKGGDRLLNPIITEKWFWAYILNGYSTKVTGTVVKDIKK